MRLEHNYLCPQNFVHKEGRKEAVQGNLDRLVEYIECSERVRARGSIQLEAGLGIRGTRAELIFGNK